MRNYSNTAVETALPLEISDVVTTFTVSSTVGWPPAPCTGLLDPDTSAEECVLVTSYLNETVTVIRGWGGTTPVRHAAGARLRHAAVAEDFMEAGLAFRHLFGEPVYDPNSPGSPPTNTPVIPTDDVVTRSAHTWADLLPVGYVSPIPQGDEP